MSGTTEITRRWSGYICPDCRFVFRVPKDHDGVGLVCPSCRRLLRLPAPGEETPPLVLSRQESVPPVVHTGHEEPPPQGELRKRRRHSKDKSAATPSWEQQRGLRSVRSERILMSSMVGGALLLVAAALIVFLKPKSGDPGPPSTVAGSQIQLPPVRPSVADEAPDVGAFLREAEPLARTFLEATTVDGLLAVVRHPKITGPRLRQRHPDGLLKPAGMESFAEGGAVVLEKNTAVATVRTGNFEERQISFFRAAEGWKVDWESWVGWSDMPWDAFMDKQPGTPTRFRVHLKPIIYYNFSFSDDRKWRSYLVESPDGNHRLFAYVERGSRVDDLINLADHPGGGDYLLDLRFPGDNPAGNQVLIHDRIAEGWVEPEPTDSP